MRFTLCLLLLAGCVYAAPVSEPVQQPTVQVQPASKTPTVIVGSSSVDGKKDGKITLHLDQRNSINQEPTPVAASVPKVSQEVKQPAPIATEPVLSGRNQPIPAQQSIPSVPAVEPAAANPVIVAEVPVAAPVSQPQPAIVVVEPPRVIVPETPVVQSAQPALSVVIVPEQVPQAIAQPVPEPQVPQILAQVPAQEPIPVVQPTLEERSSVPVVPVVAVVEPSQPVVAVQKGQELLNKQINIEDKTAVDESAAVVGSHNIVAKQDPADSVESARQKQAEQARNLKVEQTEVKTPAVVASIQKQQQQPTTVVQPVSVEPASPVQQQTQCCRTELDGKSAVGVVEQAKPEPVVSQSSQLSSSVQQTVDQVITSQQQQQILPQPTVIAAPTVVSEPSKQPLESRNSLPVAQQVPAAVVIPEVIAEVPRKEVVQTVSSVESARVPESIPVAVQPVQLAPVVKTEKVQSPVPAVSQPTGQQQLQSRSAVQQKAPIQPQPVKTKQQIKKFQAV